MIQWMSLLRCHAASGREWTWVEATVRNERMLAALENGVRGGKWFSVIDKRTRRDA